jgi:4-oxalocrotonate tautomerase
MPIVNIIVTREGTAPDRSAMTSGEKAQLIEGVSSLLLKVLGKPLESTFVTIQEIETESWGWGGLPVDEFRKSRKAVTPLRPQSPEDMAQPAEP